MIAALAVLAGAMFVFTHFVATSYEQKQHELAESWFGKGESELQTAQFGEAIHSLRSALAYSQDNFQYRLRLAQALVQDQQLRQAESYLLALWERQPGNGTVNLELARIQARNGDYEQALRFFHGAIFGVFEENPEDQRRQVRLELIQYLLRIEAMEQAHAELIALAADLPRDPELYTQVGGLFQRARGHSRALDQYRMALTISPRSPEALLGAGEAAFELGQYMDAQRYLQRALAQDGKNARATELLQLATYVRQMNPFLPRLSSQERARRVVAAFNQTQERLAQCADQRDEVLQPERASAEGQAGENSEASAPELTELQAEYQRLLSLKPQMRIVILARNPDVADSVMDAVSRAQQAAARLCGPASGRDQALLLIIHQREQAEQ